MSKQLRIAGAVSVAAMFLTTLFSAQGSGAAAKTALDDTTVSVSQSQTDSIPRFESRPVVQSLPAVAAESSAPDDADLIDEDDGPQASSLAQLVANQDLPEQLSNELNCLAGAIYFESKGETLAGQLAVGRVIVARSKSGRFPASYCGVVYQRSQFSFVRGHSMPSINRGSRNWTNAAKIALIAHEGSWQSPVEGALFFHAAYVSPGWHLKRLARIDNHIFYR